MDGVEQTARGVQAEEGIEPDQDCDLNGPTGEELEALEADLQFMAVDAPESLRPFLEQPEVAPGDLEEAWNASLDAYIDGAVDQALAWREGEYEAAVATCVENDQSVEAALWLAEACSTEAAQVAAHEQALGDAKGDLTAYAVPEVPPGFEQLAQAKGKLAELGDRLSGTPEGIDAAVATPDFTTIADGHDQALARIDVDTALLAEYRTTLETTRTAAETSTTQSDELVSLRDEVGVVRSEHTTSAASSFEASEAASATFTSSFSALESWAAQTQECVP